MFKFFFINCKCLENLPIEPKYIYKYHWSSIQVDTNIIKITTTWKTAWKQKKYYLIHGFYGRVWEIMSLYGKSYIIWEIIGLYEKSHMVLNDSTWKNGSNWYIQHVLTKVMEVWRLVLGNKSTLFLCILKKLLCLSG